MGLAYDFSAGILGLKKYLVHNYFVLFCLLTEVRNYLIFFPEDARGSPAWSFIKCFLKAYCVQSCVLDSVGAAFIVGTRGTEQKVITAQEGTQGPESLTEESVVVSRLLGSAFDRQTWRVGKRTEIFHSRWRRQFQLEQMLKKSLKKLDS